MEILDDDDDDKGVEGRSEALGTHARMLLSVARELVSSHSDRSSRERKENEEECSVRLLGLVSSLRREHRLNRTGIESRREELNREFEQLDRLQLDVENVRYEISHFEQEYFACTAFRSRHEDILFDPSNVDVDMVTGGETLDNHDCMVRRLHLELEQRKRLQEQIVASREKLETSTKENRELKEFLDNITVHLESLKKSASPLRSFLCDNSNALVVDDSSDFRIRLLPTPLYSLFYQASSTRNAHHPPEIDFSIEGTVSDTVTYAETFLISSKSQSGDGSPPSSQNQVAFPDSELEPHPLSILLRFTKSGAELRIFYIPALRTVFAKPLNTKTSRCLNGLFFEDASLSLRSLLPISADQVGKLSTLGYPHRWIQLLCGLVQSSLPSPALQPHLPVEDNSLRFLSLYSVSHQLSERALELDLTESVIQEFLNKSVTLDDAASLELNPRPAAVCSSVEEIQMSNSPEDEQIGRRFRAVFTCERLELEAMITIPSAYPRVAARFSTRFLYVPRVFLAEGLDVDKSSPVTGRTLVLPLHLQSKIHPSVLSSSTIDADSISPEKNMNFYLQEVEVAVNYEIVHRIDAIHFSHPRAKLVFPAQILQLMNCLAVLADTERRDSSNSLQSRKCFVSESGRLGEKPYFYDPYMRMFTLRGSSYDS